MTDTDHLRTYFRHDIGRVLNYSALEVVLNMPRKTLRHWVRERNPRPLADHHRASLLAWARQHGYDEQIQYDPII